MVAILQCHNMNKISTRNHMKILPKFWIETSLEKLFGGRVPSILYKRLFVHQSPICFVHTYLYNTLFLSATRRIYKRLFRRR